MQRARVVITEPLPRESLKPLESVAELTFLDRPLPPSELYPLIRDADALITRSGTRVDRELLAAAPRVRVVGRAGVGVDNIDLDAAVAKNGAVIAAYASGRDRPDFPFWPMLFDNITVRLLGSDDFPPAAKRQAASDLTAAAQVGALSIPVRPLFPFEQVALAHDQVDADNRHRVLLAIPD